MSWAELRIGDRDTALSTDRQTYVISYTLRGALRSFDGLPQLHWDVTSEDNPPIEKFTVEISGPEPPTRARCLAGATECTADVAEGRARLQGSDVARGDIITAVAEFPSGSVANAQPSLEPRRLATAEMQSRLVDATVLADGRIMVAEQIVERRPPRSSRSAALILPQRMPIDRELDWVYAVDNVEAVVDGETLRPTGTSQTNSRKASVRYSVTANDSTDENQTWQWRYVVSGAVAQSGNSSVIRWPLTGVPNYAREVTTSITWRLPAAATSVTCQQSWPMEGIAQLKACADELTPTVNGTEVTVHTTSAVVGQWLEITLPSTAVASDLATTETAPSVVATRKAWRDTVIGAAVAAALSAVAALAIRRCRRPDQRYANVAPTLVDPGGPVRNVRSDEPVPVQFGPPNGATLLQAGWLLDRRYQPRHTAAEIVQACVNGLVIVSSAPLTVRVAPGIDAADLPDGCSRIIVTEVAADDAAGPISQTRMATLSHELSSEQGRAVKQSGWIKEPPPLLRWLPLVLPVAGVAVGAVIWLLGGGPIVAAFCLLAGVTAAIMARRAKSMVARTAQATALADQVKGFRTYLETAEADQLAAEASEDIFSRFLPWAVLFDLTERWTAIGRQLARADKLSKHDLAVLNAPTSWASLAQNLTHQSRSAYNRSSSHSSVDPAPDFFSGDGSGGSSGFSSSSSGGSGGGGSSSRSW